MHLTPSMSPRRPLAWIAAAAAVALALAGCDEPELGSADRGGWDHNSGNYNGNGGSFGGTGLTGTPPWGATGPGTFTNATSFGLAYDATVSVTCATPTAGVTAVRFLSSSGTLAAAIGPDVEVERTGGARARLAMGETVVFPGRLHDGYLGSVAAVFRVRRVDTLTFREATWYEWPVFALESCVTGDAPGSFRHHGFVSWGPMVRLPEFVGEATEFRTDLVTPLTTIPRAEYVGNPNVPPAVATQTGALWWKFAFYASLPVALHGEAALDLQTASGATIANAAFLWRGALALGNASWVTLPSDPLGHRFLSFFTKDGTEVSMFGVGRGLGAIRLPAAWGGVDVDRLVLTGEERASTATLDSVQAAVTGAGVTMAAIDTHLGSGTSRYRIGRYLASSTNPLRYRFFRQWRDNVARMQVSGVGVGAIASPSALESGLGSGTGPIAWAIACQSPAAGEVFEQPDNVLEIPDGAPVEPPTSPDAGVDGTPTPDARPDAQPSFDAPPPPDAGVDAAPPPDGPGPPDAGADAAPPPDGPSPPDAGLDDAPGEGGTGDGGPPGMDAMMCFAPCADAA